MTRFSLILIIALFACGCHPGAQQQNKSSEAETTNSNSNPDPAHNARNALDWAGTYTGILPCADCEGIETILTIGTDSSYTRQTRYLGTKDESWLEISGNYTWDEAGFVITLNNLEPPNQYFVSENQVFHLDIKGNRITGKLSDNYILKKIPEQEK